MKKRYEWRVLTEDGLLKPPKDIGPYYDKDDSLRLGSWDTEEEAVAAYVQFNTKHKDDWGCADEMVLVAIYRPGKVA